MEPSGAITILCVVLVLAFALQTVKKGRSVALDLLAVAVMIAGVGGYMVYRHRKQVRADQQQAARQAEFQTRVAQFAGRYDAVTDWRKHFTRQPGRPYTLELQPLLVRADGRPILVFVSLKNVSEGDGRIEAYLDEANTFKPEFKLQLDCPIARSLSSDESSYRFEVIAQIQSVEYLQDGDYSLAKGRCLDATPVSMSDYFEFVIAPELEKRGSRGADKEMPA